jgi:hypothetical protein
MTLHDQRREDGLDKRRGHSPRIKAGEGTCRRRVLTLADRLLAAVLHYRLALPQVAVAALFRVRPETINKRLRDIRELLDGPDTPSSPARTAWPTSTTSTSSQDRQASLSSQRSRRRVNDLQALSVTGHPSNHAALVATPRWPPA